MGWAVTTLLGGWLIEQTGSGARNSKTYAVTDLGLMEVRRWLRESKPDRRVRSDAALRTFFLWLLEPAEAADRLEDERTYWQSVHDEFLRIQDEPTGRDKKSRTFRIALEGGIAGVEARLAWPPVSRATAAMSRPRASRPRVFGGGSGSTVGSIVAPSRMERSVEVSADRGNWSKGIVSSAR